MPVDSSPELKLNDKPSTHTFDGYFRALEGLHVRLMDSLTDQEQCADLAAKLCRVSRFLMFAALRERISERKELEPAIEALDRIVRSLEGFSWHSNDRQATYRNNIKERTDVLKRRLEQVQAN